MHTIPDPGQDILENQINIPLLSLPIPCVYLELPWRRHSHYGRLATYPLKRLLEKCSEENLCCDLYKSLCNPLDETFKRTYKLLDYAFVEKVKLQDQTFFCLRHVALQDSNIVQENHSLASFDTERPNYDAVFMWSYRQVRGSEFYELSRLNHNLSNERYIRRRLDNRITEHILMFYLRIQLSRLPFNFVELQNYWKKRLKQLKPHVTTVVFVFDSSHVYSDMFRSFASVDQHQQQFSWTCEDTRKIIHFTLQMNAILFSILHSHHIILAHILPLNFSVYIRRCIDEAETHQNIRTSHHSFWSQTFFSQVPYIPSSLPFKSLLLDANTSVSCLDMSISKPLSKSAPELRHNARLFSLMTSEIQDSEYSTKKKGFFQKNKKHLDAKADSSLSTVLNTLCPLKKNSETGAKVEIKQNVPKRLSLAGCKSSQSNTSCPLSEKLFFSHKRSNNFSLGKHHIAKHNCSSSPLTSCGDSFTVLKDLPYSAYRDTPWESFTSTSNTLQQTVSHDRSMDHSNQDMLTSENSFSIASLDLSDKCLY